MNKLEKIKWKITKFLFKYRIISKETAIKVSLQMALKRAKTVKGMEKLEQIYEGVRNETRNYNKKSSS